MKAAYIRAMDELQRICLWISGICLVVVTLIVPWGVFVRYVLADPAKWPKFLAPLLGFMNSVLGHDSSWPEPMAILLMIVFSMAAAAVCYRDNLHIAVMALPNALSPGPRRAMGWLAEIGMLATGLFMVIWGFMLVETTWQQTIAEFPALSTGITYLPIPIGGAIMVLFIIERFWTGKLFEAPPEGSVATTTE
ncbi:TRAP transporter small permease [Reyranella sp. CPCC 100927]|uniref:TRAP transporter small permease n=1 Tax=Reyranella sp. CPCC 100927 TaxID=2599616 RepID=UPI0011B5E182|nr:TRAP transporter small permease [Reyranella sp. CPCC 100927]TWS94961.1 TRAP transporter small permease [Reyranella sp. CPCC 100927]